MIGGVYIRERSVATVRLIVGGLWLWALLFLSPLPLFAQGAVESGPEVSAAVNKVEAFVGDAVSFTVSVIADSTLSVAPLKVDKELGDFEIQEVQIAEPDTLKDGRIHYQTTVKLWALETGEHEIPSVPVYFAAKGEGAAIDSALTSAITVTVSSVVGADIDSATIKPLREPLKDPLGLNKGFVHSRLFGILLITLILIVGFLVWWFGFRKRKEQEEWVDPRAAWEIALDRLAELRNQPYLAQELFKEYYSELTDILRDYLGSAVQTHTQDMTSSELLALLEEDSLTVVYRPQISEVLTQADKVKFAKATPKSERPIQDFETVYSVIKSLRDDLAERQRKEEERQRELLRAQKNSAKGESDPSDDNDGASGVGMDVEASPDNYSSDKTVAAKPVREGSDV